MMMTSKDTIKRDFIEKLENMYCKRLDQATERDRFNALCQVTRDYISRKWLSTKNYYAEHDEKQIYYFSIEFLLGRLLDMNLLNLGIRDITAEAMSELGIDLDRLEEVEEDPGTGNGGLGRLAACYLDSMAATGLAGHGCGIRYRYGLFEQRIVDGYQREYPDNWLQNGFPWEYRRRDEAVEVKFGGYIKTQVNGKTSYIHENYQSVIAVPYDLPIVGFKNDTVNTLRLWSSEVELTDLGCSIHNNSDCLRALEHKHEVEAISRVLYPDDTYYEGKVLRLKQQYFFVSAGLQSILRAYKNSHSSLFDLSNRIAVHINDTHPALAVPEMMRILMDDEGMTWEQAWDITVRTMSYTNHTILPEALEKWPVEMFRSLLPRIYMIVHEINERYCKELWNSYAGDWDKIRSMAIIADNQVHMAHLAIAGSHSVNGVARLHTEILKHQVMENFYHFEPYKFNNKTNGVTHRRWLLKSNRRLAQLITDTIGGHWIDYPCDLVKLSDFRNDGAFQQAVAEAKKHNKIILAKYIKEKQGINVDVHSIFDVHCKRIHAYKRQTLNVLQIMHMYNRLKDDPGADIPPRTFIFAGKSAPGYYQAKQTIKLINALADKINKDTSIRDKIKVLFLENYNVSMAELLIPAADVSEQIPAASREACGTGNMKFIMNGAVTLGTLDGGNIEIRDAVGQENVVTFGLSATEVLNYYRYGGYNPWDIYYGDQRVKRVVDQLINGFFSSVSNDEFRAIHDSFLYHGDQYFVLKDFASYIGAQGEISALYNNHSKWRKICIENIAHSGSFSSDRTFTEYAADIWKVDPGALQRCYLSDDDFDHDPRDYNQGLYREYEHHKPANNTLFQ